MEKLVITKDVLKTEDAQNFVACPSAGAISIFLGTTRDSFEDKKVTRLEYEAYDTMAYKELGKLCLDIRTKWNVAKICIMHRLGVVPIGEVSVIIAISSAHRKEAMEAVQYCIDTLKAQVPIWKKEIYSDGASTWKENSEHTSYKVENSL